MIDGVLYPIHTDFRVGIAYQMMAAAGKLTAANLFSLWFPGPWPSNVDGAMDAISRFYRRKDEPWKKPGDDSDHKAIPYDFTTDADAIHADFLREYHIDLTTAEMHWWRFMALLDGLISPSFRRRVEIRTKDLGGMKSQERAKWLKARNIYEIQRADDSCEDHLAYLDAIIAKHGGDAGG